MLMVRRLEESCYFEVDAQSMMGGSSQRHYNHLSEPAPDKDGATASLPKGYEAIIMSCLIKNG